MSYEIIYDKGFVKLPENNFIPLIMAGSNNCYEVNWNGREVRSRNWWAFTHILEGKLFGTLDEMLANCEQDRNEQQQRWQDYTDDSFGSFASLSINGSFITYGQYKGIFKSGVAKAITVEEYYAENISVMVRSLVYDQEKFKETGLEEVFFRAESSEELYEFLKNNAFRYKRAGYPLQIQLSASEKDMRRMRKRRFPRHKREKKPVERIKVYIIRTGEGYFVENSRGGYRYSPHRSSAKEFPILTTATKQVDRLRERHPRSNFEIQPVQLDTPKTFYI